MSAWWSPVTWYVWLRGDDIPDTHGDDGYSGRGSAPAHAPGAPAPGSPQQGEDYDGGNLYHLRPASSPVAGLAIIRARPRCMDDAPAVADKIKQGLPVTVNLEGIEEPIARRVVDFIGGVTYALDGSIKKIGRAVFVCSPSDIPIEDLDSEEPLSPREALFDEHELRQVAQGR